jgi:hypothetical protein
VTSDGKSTGSLGKLIKIDDNTLEWQSLEATVEGDPIPDLKLRLVKKR